MWHRARAGRPAERRLSETASAAAPGGRGSSTLSPSRREARRHAWVREQLALQCRLACAALCASGGSARNGQMLKLVCEAHAGAGKCRTPGIEDGAEPARSAPAPRGLGAAIGVGGGVALAASELASTSGVGLPRVLRQPRDGLWGQWNSTCTSKRTVVAKPRASVATSTICAVPSLASSGCTSRAAPTMRAVAMEASDDDAAHVMPSGASPGATSETSGRRGGSPAASGSGAGAASGRGGRWNRISGEPGTVSKPRKQGVPLHCAVGVSGAAARRVRGDPAGWGAAKVVPVVSPAATATAVGRAVSAAGVGEALSMAVSGNGAPRAARAVIVAGPGAQGSASARTSVTASGNGAPGLSSTVASRRWRRPANRPGGRASRALAERSRRSRPARPSRSFPRRAPMSRAFRSSAGMRARSAGRGQRQSRQPRASASRTAGVRSQTPSWIVAVACARRERPTFAAGGSSRATTKRSRAGSMSASSTTAISMAAVVSPAGIVAAPALS